MSGDLFSAGFAWDDVAPDATAAATRSCEYAGTGTAPASQPRATATATAEDGDFAGGFAWSDGDVAGVAGVAAGPSTPEGVAVSQPSRATAVATPETADFCGVEGEFLAAVAPVASVADWAAQVARLREGRPPEGIDGLAWRRLISDARALIGNWGADLIRAGWTTVEVFGVNPDPRARRLDRVGLCRLLKGRPVEAIDGETALIRVSATDMHTFHRRLVAPGGVPFWLWAGEN